MSPPASTSSPDAPPNTCHPPPTAPTSEALEYVPASSAPDARDPPSNSPAQANSADIKHAPAPSRMSSRITDANMTKRENQEENSARASEEKPLEGPTPTGPPAETAPRAETPASPDKMEIEMVSAKAQTLTSAKSEAKIPDQNPDNPVEPLTASAPEAPALTSPNNSDGKPTEAAVTAPSEHASNMLSEASTDNSNGKKFEATTPEEKSVSTNAVTQSSAEIPATELPSPSTASRKRSRRLSTRASAMSPPRTLRPRTSSNPADTEADAVRPDVQPVSAPQQMKTESEPSPPEKEISENTEDTNQEDDDKEDLPRPIMTEKGLKMVVGDSVFVTFNQLEDIKRQRMRGKNLKPIEQLTFQDILSYNRDQLRCYCYIYSTPRRKKSEMEVDMARFVSLWNEGKPGYVFAEYVPKNSGRIDASSLGARSMFNDRRTVLHTQQSNSAQHSTDAISNSPSDRALGRSMGGANARSFDRTLSRIPVRASPPASLTASAKRPPPRPATLQPSPIRPSLPPRLPGSERRTGAIPTNQSFPNHASSPGLGRNSAGSSSKSGRTAIPVQNMPQGYNTSHKQKVHARAAGMKYKAAYNGAGPAIVNIVENAASYFEGRDSAEVISDRAKAYERYQLNVDLLTEIFDGPSSESEDDEIADGTAGKENGQSTAGGEGNTSPKDIHMIDVNGNDVKHPEEGVSQELAQGMASKAKGRIGNNMELWEQTCRRTEKNIQENDRANMRLFQRLERAETEQEIEAVRNDFERVNNTRLPGAPPPLIRRKLNKSLPAMHMPDDKCHILRFKVA